MSVQDQLEFDFWQFVSCAKCRLPFILDNGGSTIPFWLTECGHVICNTHLSPDQSCSQCGSRDIQLAPLQREMEAPMSDWFQPIPQALESVSYAVKFQQDAMASQLQYYRSRHQQFRQILDRMNKDLSNSKKETEALRRENEQLRLQLSQQGDDGYMINANGKRQMTLAHESSSSRSIRTPIGPDRLTLQTGQSFPELSHDAKSSRPLSSLSLDKYAYKGSDNQGYTPPTLSHAQSAPRTFQRFQPQSCQPRAQKNDSQTTNNNNVIPSSSRFKPAGLPPTTSSRNNPMAQFQRTPNMGPPPTPQHHPQNTTVFRNAPNPTYIPPASRQIGMPSTSSRGVAASASTPQRFFSNGLLPRTGATRPNNISIPPMTSGQRSPFIHIPEAPK